MRVCIQCYVCPPVPPRAAPVLPHRPAAARPPAAHRCRRRASHRRPDGGTFGPGLAPRLPPTHQVNQRSAAPAGPAPLPLFHPRRCTATAALLLRLPVFPSGCGQRCAARGKPRPLFPHYASACQPPLPRPPSTNIAHMDLLHANPFLQDYEPAPPPQPPSSPYAPKTPTHTRLTHFATAYQPPAPFTALSPPHHM
jgi:hypothetical protein